MAADVGEELFERIRADFEKKYKSHAHAQSILKRIERGTADQIDLNSYARSLGHCLAEAIEENITPADLPNETMYYNIAQKILEPMLRQNHQLVNQAADTIQRRLDQGSGIHIRPQTAPFPDDRVQDVLWKVYHDGADAEKAVERMSRASDTMTRGFADDYVKANADFRTEAGVQCYITRTTDGASCPWCASLAGRYRYPEGTPKDVFRRHDNCGCVVTYECGDMRQKSWSKRNWDNEHEREYLRQLDQEKKAKRSSASGQTDKKIKLTPKEAAERERRVLDKFSKTADAAERPKVRYTPSEAAKKEAEVQEKYRKAVDKSGESGIIKLEDEIVPHSIGAKRRGYDVRDLKTGEHFDLVSGTYIRDKHIFAGKGSSTPYRKAYVYAERFHNNPEDWSHVKGIGTVDYYGDAREAELHWSECAEHGKVDIFIKRWLDES